MGFAAIPIYLAAIVLIGYGTCSIWIDTRHRAGVIEWLQRIAWSYAAGLALLVCCLTAAEMLGAPLLAGWIVVAIISVGCWLKNRSPLDASNLARRAKTAGQDRAIGAIAGIVLVAAATNVVCAYTTQNLTDVDVYADWFLKAKLLYAFPLRPIPPALLAPALSFSHQDYPPGWPLLVMQLWRWMGRIDELATLPLYLIGFGALTCILWSELHRRMNSGWALAATALLMASPVVVSGAGTATADFLLMLFYAAAMTLLLRWIDTGRAGNLFGAACFTAAAALTKNEGLLMALLFAGGAFVGALISNSIRTDATPFGIASEFRNLRDVCLALVLAAATLAPWLIYRRHLPHTVEDYGGRIWIHPTVHLVAATLGLGRYCLEVFTAGPIWIVAILALAVSIRKSRPPSFWIAVSLAALHFCGYCLILSVTPQPLAELIPQIGPKLLMHISPLLVLMLSQTVAE